MYLFRFFILILISLAALAFSGGRGQLYAQTIIEPDPDSEIRIEGRSNINQFSCDAERYEGGAVIEGEMPDDFRQLTDKAIRLELKIPVLGFECGRRRMNRDLYDALNTDEFLYITFELTDASSPSSYEARSGHYKLDVQGILTVSGVPREISFTADASLLQARRVRVTGHKKITMTNFDVIPPSGLFGLVQAEDELVVHFDLFASLTESSQPSGDQP